MSARLSAMMALLTAGCAGGLIDPCAGKPATCVGVHLDSTVTPLDQLRITLDQRASAFELTPVPSSALAFPVRFAIELPAATTSARLDFDGLFHGEDRAHAMAMVSIPASGHVDLPTITMRAATLDGGVEDAGPRDGGAHDAALDALPIIDAAPPDLIGTVPITITYAGNGTGQVTANGETCAAPSCTLNFLPGTIVNLVAAANAPVSIFNYWGGSCSGTANTCAITLTSAATAVANFHRTYNNLTVITYGSGSVTPSPAGISCGANCWSYAPATQVTLSETPTGSASFAGWGATNCGHASTCMLTTNSDIGVIASFTTGPVNYVFITSTTYTIAQLDASGTPQATADGFCQASASAAVLANAASYKAWLAVTGTSASSRLGSARGWARMDGLPFADSVASLMSGAVFYPIAFTETNVAATGTPWTGAKEDGTATTNCTNFTLTTGQSAGAVPTGGARAWSSGGSPACSGSAALVCFGTAATTPVSVTAPANARRGFLTQGTFTAGSIDDANTLCSTEATTAALTGTYQPFLATAGSGGLSGLDVYNAGPWVRGDGVLLAPLPINVDFNGAGTLMLAPLDQLANGNRVGAAGFAWSGVNGNSCAGWTENTSAIIGDATSFGQVGVVGTTACNFGLPVFCLQQ